MAEAAEKNPHPVVEGGELQAAADMDLEAQSPGEPEPEENSVGKRGRGECEDREGEQRENGAAKRLKVEKSVEEERLERLEGEGRVDGEEKDAETPVTVCLGPKVFGTSSGMFEYFYKLLHSWTPHIDVNMYEHMVLLDLLKKGHRNPDAKVGDGIQAFQVRNHPMWKSRCFFLVRVDGSSDDFSFRKCVDQILPLPDNMKPHDNNDHKNVVHQKVGGRGGSGGGGRGGRGGRGRRVFFIFRESDSAINVDEQRPSLPVFLQT